VHRWLDSFPFNLFSLSVFIKFIFDYLSFCVLSFILFFLAFFRSGLFVIHADSLGFSEC
jgi:hypothetical protein